MNFSTKFFHTSLRAMFLTWNISLALLLISTAVWASSAMAQQSAHAMRFSVERVCIDQACEALIIADGLIEPESHTKLTKLLQAAPTGTTLLELNSYGGDLPGALQLGETIRNNRLNTRVRLAYPKGVADAASFQPAECYSACVLAFMGGVNRTLSERAKFGVQSLQTAQSTAQSLPQESGFNLLALIGLGKSEQSGDRSGQVPRQAAAAVLGRYLDRMGIDRRALDFILTAVPGQINYIDTQRAKLYAVDNQLRAPTASQWQIGATNRGVLVGTITEVQRSGNYSITLGLAPMESEMRLLVHVKPLSSNNIADVALQKALASIKAPVLQSGVTTLSPTVTKGWSPVKDGYQLWARISPEELSKLAEQSNFPLILESNSTIGLDSRTTFSTVGLKNYLAALEKK